MGATVFEIRTAEDKESVTCFECGVEFASPILRFRRKDRKTFWCPNGHGQGFTGGGELEKLREELEKEKRRREMAEADSAWQRAEAKNARVQVTKAKNKLKRIETRINAGVCPHCNRTFQQLARHMKCKHAEAQASLTPDS